jgi:hypothetical protein
MQILGLSFSLVAGVFLVIAFFKAYPSEKPGAALTAMSGGVLTVGCSCCLVTMGVTGLAHAMFPSQLWLAKTSPVYILAAALMSVGLYRLGSPVAAAMAIAGQAFLYFWLEVPYSSLPSVILHGVNSNFVIKYPMMFVGGLIVMGGFALAFRRHEQRAFSNTSAMAPSFGD